MLRSSGTAGDHESRRLAYEIIVAADGTDGTREIVRDLARSNPALRAIGSDARCGKGRGIRQAVAIADGNVSDAIFLGGLSLSLGILDAACMAG